MHSSTQCLPCFIFSCMTIITLHSVCFDVYRLCVFTSIRIWIQKMPFRRQYPEKQRNYPFPWFPASHDGMNKSQWRSEGEGRCFFYSENATGLSLSIDFTRLNFFLLYNFSQFYLSLITSRTKLLIVRLDSKSLL